MNFLGLRLSGMLLIVSAALLGEGSISSRFAAPKEAGTENKLPFEG